jgi:hypothetical protein
MDYPKESIKSIKGLLRQLKIQGGVNSTGFITSPTPWGNNIDALVTNIEGEFNSVPFYIVPDNFAGYINDEQVPASLKEHYKSAVKCVLPSKESNSQAIAKASKGIVVVGGGGDSLLDALKQIEEGNKVVMVNMDTLPQEAWDVSKSRPKNATKYFKKQLEHFDLTGTLKYLEYEEAGLTLDYIKRNRKKLEDKVMFIDLNPTNMRQTAETIIKHLR